MTGSRLAAEAYTCGIFAALPLADALRRYVEHGYPTTQFLTAVLENDLMEAIVRADDDNLDALEAYCAWLRTYAPSACYGSADRVRDWIAAGGLSRRRP